MPKDCLHFFSLPLPSLPLLSTALQLLVFIFSCCYLTLIVFSALSFLVPLSLVPALFISYITARLASLARSLQLHCHPSCFSFCCSGAGSVYTLMMSFQWEHLVSHWRKHPGDLVAHGGLVSWSFSMLWYGGLCVTRCLVYSDVLPYYSSSS